MTVKCARCRDGIPHEIRHGATAYRQCGCRCQECTTEQREWQASWREKNRAKVAKHSADHRARRAGIAPDNRTVCNRCGNEFARIRRAAGTDWCIDCRSVETLLARMETAQ